MIIIKYNNKNIKADMKLQKFYMLSWLYFIAISSILISGCDDNKKEIKISDISRLYSAKFPSKGRVSVIQSKISYEEGDAYKTICEYSPKFYSDSTISSYSLTEGQNLFFKDLDVDKGILCITGGNIQMTSPDSRETLNVPVISPILGNKNVEIPVSICYINESPSHFEFKGCQTFPEYDLKVEGNIDSRLNKLNLSIDYLIKETASNFNQNISEWYSMYDSKSSDKDEVTIPFKFKGLQNMEISDTGLSPDEVMDFILSSQTISLERLGFGSTAANKYASISEIYQILCYGIDIAGVGKECGFIIPQYYYHEDDCHYEGCPVMAFVCVPTMPYFSFQYLRTGKDYYKVFINLSSLISLRMVEMEYSAHPAISRLCYFPLNTYSFRELQYNIASAFGEKAAMGINLRSEYINSSAGSDLIMWISDPSISRSLLTALINLYVSDPENLNNLKEAINNSKYSSESQSIIDFVLTMDQRLEACTDFQLGFRYNNYWPAETEESLSLYKLIWGHIGTFMGHWKRPRY